MANNFSNRVYLGDGVYAWFDGYHIVLEVHTEHSIPNTIYLDDLTFAALMQVGRKWFFGEEAQDE